MILPKRMERSPKAGTAPYGGCPRCAGARGIAPIATRDDVRPHAAAVLASHEDVPWPGAVPADENGDRAATLEVDASDHRFEDARHPGKEEHRAGGAFVHRLHKLSAWPCGFRVQPAGEAST